MIGFLVLAQRPAIDTAVHTSLPTAHSAVTLTGLAGQAAPAIRARLRTLVVNGGAPREAEESGGAESEELVLPVRGSACKRLVGALGGSCGGLSRPSKRIQPPLIVNWPRGATVSAMWRSPRSLQLLPPPGEAPMRSLSTWTLRASADRARLAIDCASSSRVSITAPGVGSIGTGCAETHPVRWHLPIGFGPDTTVKDLDLIDLSSLRAQATARAARLEVDQALLRLGDSFRRLKSHRGVPVEVRAAQQDPVAFELDVSSAPERTALSVESQSAAKVKVGGGEAIPTIFSRNEEIWLPIVFALAGIIATAWLDRFLGFR